MADLDPEEAWLLDLLRDWAEQADGQHTLGGDLTYVVDRDHLAAYSQVAPQVGGQDLGEAA